MIPLVPVSHSVSHRNHRNYSSSGNESPLSKEGGKTCHTSNSINSLECCSWASHQGPSTDPTCFELPLALYALFKEYDIFIGEKNGASDCTLIDSYILPLGDEAWFRFLLSLRDWIQAEGRKSWKDHVLIKSTNHHLIVNYIL